MIVAHPVAAVRLNEQLGRMRLEKPETKDSSDHEHQCGQAATRCYRKRATGQPERGNEQCYSEIYANL